jgi:hypothetical protein
MLKMKERDSFVFDWLIENFIFTKIMTPDGDVYVKNRGVPSGSYFT